MAVLPFGFTWLIEMLLYRQEKAVESEEIIVMPVNGLWNNWRMLRIQCLQARH